MTDLLVKPTTPDADGQVLSITPKSAGWTYVGFDMLHLKPGQSVERDTGDREVCLVLVSGTATIQAGDETFAKIGKRQSPFDGLPTSVYVPADNKWTATADTDVELAVCSAPGQGGILSPRLIGPEACSQETRGTGTNTRHVTNILSENEPAESLLVVEVITPGGNWSSYPPHKHDRDAFPEETQLEETYYHRTNPPQGFAFQRVYTDDRSLDETMLVSNGDCVLVPRGYHPVGASHGYDLYYLNVMAGPKRVWRFKNDPAHEWMVQPA